MEREAHVTLRLTLVRGCLNKTSAALHFTAFRHVYALIRSPSLFFCDLLAVHSGGNFYGSLKWEIVLAPKAFMARRYIKITVNVGL